MSSLSLVLSPPALQRLHDALSCLAKFSEYVTIEATRNNLCLAALNSSKSAHGAINLLGGRFFDSYHFTSTQSRNLGLSVEELKFQCRLHTKALLSVFRQRYLDSKDKDTAIEKCELTLGDKPTRGECRILVRFLCKHGVVKTYKLVYEDVDVMHAVFDKNATDNRWTMSSKLLKEYIEHFGPKAEQLDISGDGRRATMTSYTEKLMDGIEILKQPLHTAVSMDTGEFEEFTVEGGLHITVNLKDFKAIVSHADSLDATLSAYYSDPGRPLQLQYDHDGMSCEFTLMTTGSGGNLGPPLIRAVARVIAPRPSAGQPMGATFQRLVSGDPSEQGGADYMQGLEQAPMDHTKQEASYTRATDGVLPANPGAGTELSLFLDGESIEEDKELEDDDDILGWDVDMDHTVSAVAIPAEDGCSPNAKRRTGPTVTQSRQTNYYMQLNHQQQLAGDANSSDEEDDDLIVGPTQEISQAKGLFD